MNRQPAEIDGSRKGMYYGGIALTVVGFLIFISNFFLMPGFGGIGNMEGAMRGFAGRAIVGMLFIIVGGVLRKIGMQGLAGSGVVLDPEQARKDVEPWSRMAGGVVNDALSEVDLARDLGKRSAAPAEVVKVRCVSCRALNDESSKFCAQCGKPLQ